MIKKSFGYQPFITNLISTCFQLKLQAKEVVRERGLEKVKLEDLVTIVFFTSKISFIITVEAY
jgi:hypothetical protein